VVIKTGFGPHSVAKHPAARPPLLARTHNDPPLDFVGVNDNHRTRGPTRLGHLLKPRLQSAAPFPKAVSAAEGDKIHRRRGRSIQGVGFAVKRTGPSSVEEEPRGSSTGCEVRRASSTTPDQGGRGEGTERQHVTAGAKQRVINSLAPARAKDLTDPVDGGQSHKKSRPERHTRSSPTRLHDVTAWARWPRCAQRAVRPSRGRAR